jgi:eukaryotic-like serine/threonine-protein kinase
MLAPGTRFGHLVIHRLIGRGGMGEVYEAEQTTLRRRVAVKRIADHLLDHPEARRRFEREAQTVARLHGEHLVAVHEFASLVADGDPTARPHLLLVLELVEGGLSLRRVLERGRIVWPEASSIIRQAARGLGQAAEHGVVHRDIKPDNLLLTARGVVKITDFGLAKSMDSSAISMDGAVVGTAAYLPPEACRGEPIGHAGDLYSLGATWFHLLAGRPPFAGDSVPALMRCHLDEAPPDVRALAPDVPAPVAELIVRLLAKDPAQRPADAATVVAAIDALGAQVPATVPALALADVAQVTALLPTTPATAAAAAPTVVQAAPRPRWRRPAAGAALIAIAVLAGAGAMWWLRPLPTDAPAAVPAPEPAPAPTVTAVAAPAPALSGDADVLATQLDQAISEGRLGDAERLAETLDSRGWHAAKVAAVAAAVRQAERAWGVTLDDATTAVDAGNWSQAHALLADVPADRVVASRGAATRRAALDAQVRSGARLAFAEARQRMAAELEAGRVPMARHHLMLAHALAGIAGQMPEYHRELRRLADAERSR